MSVRICHWDSRWNWANGWGRNQVNMGTREHYRMVDEGSRHDTLDDHFAYHNFIKMIGLGELRPSFPCSSLIDLEQGTCFIDS